MAVWKEGEASNIGRLPTFGRRELQVCRFSRPPAQWKTMWGAFHRSLKSSVVENGEKARAIKLLCYIARVFVGAIDFNLKCCVCSFVQEKQASCVL